MSREIEFTISMKAKFEMFILKWQQGGYSWKNRWINRWLAFVELLAPRKKLRGLFG